MNKKATDKIISIYWFTILFIVAASIVYMVLIFYGKPYDVRELEANILTNQIADCMAKGGYLQEYVLESTFQDNFKEKCKLNFKVEDYQSWKEDSQYYVEVSVLDFNNNNNNNNLIVDSFIEGNPNLKSDCNKGGGNFPVCVKRKFYALGENNKQYTIEILSIVRKTEKNVK